MSDRDLAFQCKLAVDRPDLRSTAWDASVRRLWRAREESWQSSPLSHHLEVLIRSICQRALGPLKPQVASARLLQFREGNLLKTHRAYHYSPEQSHLAKPELGSDKASTGPYLVDHARPETDWSNVIAAVVPPPDDAVAQPMAPPPAQAVPVSPWMESMARPGAALVAPDAFNAPLLGSSPDQLEPWPPPVPTASEAYDLIPGTMKTVGEVADALSSRLRRAGAQGLRFWSAPGGVAIVVPSDAVDSSGQSVARSGPRGFIIAGLMNMVASPIRDSRVLLVVLTTDQKVRHSQAKMSESIATHWVADGDMRSRFNREQPLTPAHFVAIFAYELHRDGIEEPHLVSAKETHREVPEELTKAGISMDGLLR